MHVDYGDWTVWNSLSYTMLSGVQSRQQAEEEYNKLGSKLTSIASNIEASFISSIQRSFTTWIGCARLYVL